MKIDVSRSLRGYDGKVLFNVIREEGSTKGGPAVVRKREPLTIRNAISIALNNVLPGEILKAEEKSRIYQISTKIWSKKKANLTVDEMSFIKERAGKILFPVAYGRLCEVFDKK